jgi:hypothetical protein
MVSTDVKFPRGFLWAIEKTELAAAIQAARANNQKKVASATARTLFLYFVVVKVLLLQIFLRPVNAGVIKKPNGTLETNLTVISVIMFRTVQIACGHPEETQSAATAEFTSAIPNIAEYKFNWLSPQTITSIQSWAARLRDWATKSYKEITKT